MLTKQKSIIRKVLAKTKRPLSKDDILFESRKQHPRLGSATVDRYIKEMRNSYDLVGLSFPGQPTRFELPSKKEHPHFICRVCKKVFDLDIPMKLPRVSLPEGFNVSGGEVVYSGTCPGCVGEI